METSYQFNITIEGKGETVDEAFQNAIDSFNKDPGLAIKEEVIFTKKTSKTKEIEA
tara:strand:- start:14 stop:181 length:168 start_codon:yes stop_codon:yes gene_type:complete